jgi:Zn-dependent protease
MNFSLAFLAALVARDQALPESVVDAIAVFIRLNLVLGIFNLLPIPPLDGGRIAVGVLPLRMARAWAGLERYGMVLVLALIAGPTLLAQLGIHFNPLGDTLEPAVNWAFGATLFLAGVPTGEQ